MSKQILITIICMIVFVGAAVAQPSIDPPGSAVPLDGGIGFLLAAGIAYGSKKIYDQRKDGDEPTDFLN